MVWTCLCSVKCNKVKEESSKLSKQIKMLHKRKWKKIYKHLHTVIPYKNDLLYPVASHLYQD